MNVAKPKTLEKLHDTIISLKYKKDDFFEKFLKCQNKSKNLKRNINSF